MPVGPTGKMPVLPPRFNPSTLQRSSLSALRALRSAFLSAGFNFVTLLTLLTFRRISATDGAQSRPPLHHRRDIGVGFAPGF